MRLLKRVLYTPAAIAVVATLALLLGSCSGEQTESWASEEAVGSYGLRASLVPIVHLTSAQEDVSVQELSQNGELAIPQESQELVEELLGRSDFGSGEEVVDYVSRTPEAVGLVPWDQIDPRVKALAVDGDFLLDPGREEPESYPLSSENPDPQELRRVVVGGDIVLDRGQPFAVFEEGRGIDFPLNGGYAAITSRALVPNPYSESNLVYQFTAERQGEGG